MENFKFNAEAAALRTELVGNLKIDATSEESKRLLEQWAGKGEQLVESGSVDKLEWNKEEAEIYIEADATAAAVGVLRVALFEAEQQGNTAEASYFSRRLKDLGEDPDAIPEEFI